MKPQIYAEAGIQNVGAELQRTLDTDHANADARVLSLIGLLRTENEVANEKRSQALAGTLPDHERLSEEYMNYYGDVILAVSSLRDPRSLPVLLGAITTGNMVIDALVSFGSTSVEPVVSLLESSDNTVRSAAVFTLLRMIQQAPAVINDTTDRATIKVAITRTATDPDPFVRIRAVQALAEIGDADSIALIQEIARSDTYQAEFMEGNPYIVRMAALEALQSRQVQ